MADGNEIMETEGLEAQIRSLVTAAEQLAKANEQSAQRIERAFKSAFDNIRSHAASAQQAVAAIGGKTPVAPGSGGTGGTGGTGGGATTGGGGAGGSGGGGGKGKGGGTSGGGSGDPNEDPMIKTQVRAYQDNVKRHARQLRDLASQIDVADAAQVQAWRARLEATRRFAKTNNVDSEFLRAANMGERTLTKRIAGNEAARAVAGATVDPSISGSADFLKAAKRIAVDQMRDINAELARKVALLDKSDPNFTRRLQNLQQELQATRKTNEELAKRAGLSKVPVAQMRALDNQASILDSKHSSYRKTASPQAIDLGNKRSELSLARERMSLVDFKDTAAVQGYKNQITQLRGELSALGAKASELARIDTLLDRIDNKAAKAAAPPKSRRVADPAEAMRMAYSDEVKRRSDDLIHRSKLIKSDDDWEVRKWQKAAEAHRQYISQLQGKGLVGGTAHRSLELAQHNLGSRNEAATTRRNERGEADVTRRTRAYWKEETEQILHNGRMADQTSSRKVRLWLNEARAHEKSLKTLGQYPAELRRVQIAIKQVQDQQNRLKTMRGDMGPGSEAMIAAAGAMYGLQRVYSDVVLQADELTKSQISLAQTAKVIDVPMGKLAVTSQMVREEFGLTTMQANALTTEIAKLTVKAGDIEVLTAATRAFLNLGASRGLSSEQTLKAVQQALIGLDEGTDKLFNANPSALYKRYADSIGIAVGKMNDQQKAMALLKYGMEDASRAGDAYAAFLRTAAGQSAILANKTTELKAQIGTTIQDLRMQFFGVAGAATSLAQGLDGVLVPAVVGLTTAVVGLGIAFGALKLGAFISMIRAAHPAMRAITVIGGLAGAAWATYGTQVTRARQDAEKEFAKFDRIIEKKVDHATFKNKDGTPLKVPVFDRWEIPTEELVSEVQKAEQELERVEGQARARMKRRRMNDDEMEAELARSIPVQKAAARLDVAKQKLQNREDMERGVTPPKLPPAEDPEAKKRATALRNMIEKAEEEEAQLYRNESAYLAYKAASLGATEAQRQYIAAMNMLADTDRVMDNHRKSIRSLVEDASAAGKAQVEANRTLTDLTDRLESAGEYAEKTAGQIARLRESIRLGGVIADDLQIASQGVKRLDNDLDLLYAKLQAGPTGDANFINSMAARERAIAKLREQADLFRAEMAEAEAMAAAATDPRIRTEQTAHARDAGRRAEENTQLADQLDQQTPLLAAQHETKQRVGPAIELIESLRRKTQDARDEISAGPYGQAGFIGALRELNTLMKASEFELYKFAQAQSITDPVTQQKAKTVDEVRLALQRLHAQMQEEYKVNLQVEGEREATNKIEEMERAIRRLQAETQAALREGETGRRQYVPSSDIQDILDNPNVDEGYKDELIKLDKARQQHDRLREMAEEYRDVWRDGLADIRNSFIDTFTNALATGKGSFREFSISILQMISQMLIKMATLRAMMALTGNFGGVEGLFGGGTAPVQGQAIPGGGNPPGHWTDSSRFYAHTGGVVGSADLGRRNGGEVPRFHTGGLVGGEMPIIAMRGEGVFTQGQMSALGSLVREPSPPPFVQITVPRDSTVQKPVEVPPPVVNVQGPRIQIDNRPPTDVRPASNPDTPIRITAPADSNRPRTAADRQVDKLVGERRAWQEAAKAAAASAANPPKEAPAPAPTLADRPTPRAALRDASRTPRVTPRPITAADLPKAGVVKDAPNQELETLMRENEAKQLRAAASLYMNPLGAPARVLGDVPISLVQTGREFGRQVDMGHYWTAAGVAALGSLDVIDGPSQVGKGARAAKRMVSGIPSAPAAFVGRNDFRSYARQAVVDAPQARGDAAYWRGVLDRAGVSKTERERTGIDYFLNRAEAHERQQTRFLNSGVDAADLQLTRSDIIDQLDSSPLQIKDTVRSTDEVAKQKLEEAERRYLVARRGENDAYFRHSSAILRAVDTAAGRRMDADPALAARLQQLLRTRDNLGVHVGPEWNRITNEMADAIDPGASAAMQMARREAEEAGQARSAAQAAQGVNPATSAKYQRWTSPGGTNYREILLQHPADPADLTRRNELKERLDDLQNRRRLLSDASQGIRPTTKAGEEELDRLLQEIDEAASEHNAILDRLQGWKGKHWSEPNVFAHMRVTDRNLPGLGRSYHIEEIQSDLNQIIAKRKKDGERFPSRPSDSVIRQLELDVERREAAMAPAEEAEREAFERLNTARHVDLFRKGWDIKAPDASNPFAKLSDAELANTIKGLEARQVSAGNARRQALGDLSRAEGDLQSAREAPPLMPFNKTDEWTGVGLRRAIADAVANGYDTISLPVAEDVWKATGMDPGALEGLRYYYNKVVPAQMADEVRRLTGRAPEFVRTPVIPKDAEFGLGFESGNWMPENVDDLEEMFNEEIFIQSLDGPVFRHSQEQSEKLIAARDAIQGIMTDYNASFAQAVNVSTAIGGRDLEYARLAAELSGGKIAPVKSDGLGQNVVLKLTPEIKKAVQNKGLRIGSTGLEMAGGISGFGFGGMAGGALAAEAGTTQEERQRNLLMGAVAGSLFGGAGGVGAMRAVARTAGRYSPGSGLVLPDAGLMDGVEAPIIGRTGGRLQNRIGALDPEEIVRRRAERERLKKEREAAEKAAEDKLVAKYKANLFKPRRGANALNGMGTFQWRPLDQLYTLLGSPTRITPEAEQFGYFMIGQAERAVRGQLTTRDILKANAITHASIQRRALPVETLRKSGFPVPEGYTDLTMRPEGAMAELLMTPMGQRYLDMGERGIVDMESIDKMAKLFKPFGKALPTEASLSTDNIRDRLIQNVTDVGPLAPQFNRIVAESFVGDQNIAREQMRALQEQIKGIGAAKRWFLPSMLGGGADITWDAREIMAHTGLTTEVAGRIIGSGGRNEELAISLARRRLEAMQLVMPTELERFRPHMLHHTAWDLWGDKAARVTPRVPDQTTHGDLMRVMDPKNNYAIIGGIGLGGLSMLALPDRAEAQDKPEEAQQSQSQPGESSQPSVRRRGGPRGDDEIVDLWTYIPPDVPLAPAQDTIPRVTPDTPPREAADRARRAAQTVRPPKPPTIGPDMRYPQRETLAEKNARARRWLREHQRPRTEPGSASASAPEAVPAPLAARPMVSPVVENLLTPRTSGPRPIVERPPGPDPALELTPPGVAADAAMVGQSLREHQRRRTEEWQRRQRAAVEQANLRARSEVVRSTRLQPVVGRPETQGGGASWGSPMLDRVRTRRFMLQEELFGESRLPGARYTEPRGGFWHTDRSKGLIPKDFYPEFLSRLPEFAGPLPPRSPVEGYAGKRAGAPEIWLDGVDVTARPRGAPAPQPVSVNPFAGVSSGGGSTATAVNPFADVSSGGSSTATAVNPFADVVTGGGSSAAAAPVVVAPRPRLTQSPTAPSGSAVRQVAAGGQAPSVTPPSVPLQPASVPAATPIPAPAALPELSIFQYADGAEPPPPASGGLPWLQDVGKGLEQTLGTGFDLEQEMAKQTLARLEQRKTMDMPLPPQLLDALRDKAEGTGAFADPNAGMAQGVAEAVGGMSKMDTFKASAGQALLGIGVGLITQLLQKKPKEEKDFRVGGAFAMNGGGSSNVDMSNVMPRNLIPRPGTGGSGGGSTPGDGRTRESIPGDGRTGTTSVGATRTNVNENMVDPVTGMPRRYLTGPALSTRDQANEELRRMREDGLLPDAAFDGQNLTKKQKEALKEATRHNTGDLRPVHQGAIQLSDPNEARAAGVTEHFLSRPPVAYGITGRRVAGTNEFTRDLYPKTLQPHGSQYNLPTGPSVPPPPAPAGASDGFARAASVETGFRSLGGVMERLLGPGSEIVQRATMVGDGMNPFAVGERDGRLRILGNTPASSATQGGGRGGDPDGPPVVEGSASALRALGRERREPAMTLQMKNEFSIQALDSRDVSQMLKAQGGTISGIVADQARNSLTYRRELLGGRN